MQLNLHLSQQQNLKLSLTPELRQSIDILQIHSLDLAAYLQENALDNPIIEIEFPMVPISRKQKSTKNHSDVDHPLAVIKAPGLTLEEWLISQLRLRLSSSIFLETASFLAGNLNDDGYLTISLEEASKVLSQPMDCIEKSLELLQSLDPPGVGARSLQECLLIQMRHDPNCDPKARLVVGNHFIDLARGKFEQIAKKCKISTEKWFALLEYIRNLYPRPGLAFTKAEHQYIIPDAEIIKINGELFIQLLNGHLPKISFNQQYCEWEKNKSSVETSSFLREKLQEARSLVKSLKQRNVTLYRVIQAITEEQREFFEQGRQDIKPMNLKSISTKLGLHESTVSRAVQNKYVQTPNGIFELKFFFSYGLASKDGHLTSRNTLKHEIKQLIDKEPKEKPLSDTLINDLLEKKGIQISRRTVTKYREEMQILSSAFRKR